MTLVAPVSFGLTAAEIIGTGGRVLPVLNVPAAVGISAVIVGSLIYDRYNKVYDLPAMPDELAQGADSGTWVPLDFPDQPDPTDSDLKKDYPIHDLKDYDNAMDYLSRQTKDHEIFDALADQLIQSYQDKLAEDLTAHGKNPNNDIPDLSSLKDGLKDALLGAARAGSSEGGGAPPPAVAEKKKIDLSKKSVDEQKKATEATEKATEESKNCNEELVSRLDAINDTLQLMNDKLKNQNSSNDGNNPDNPDNNEDDEENTSDNCNCLTKNDWLDIITNAINYDKLALVFARSFTKRVQKDSTAQFHLLKDETQSASLLNDNIAEILENDLIIKDEDGWKEIIIPDTGDYH